MLMQAELDASWWPHAFMHCAYILNRVPSRDAPSPYFAVTNKEPDLTRLRVFGCVAFRHLDYDRRQQPNSDPLANGAGRPRKLAPRSDQLVYIGNAENSTSFKLCRRDEPQTVLLSDAAHFAEHTVVDRARVRPDNGSSAFDVSPPEGDMLRERINDFTVITHRTMRHRDRNAAVGEVADEIVAIFRVHTPDHPHGIWTEVENILDNNNAGYDIIEEYLRDYQHDHRNTFYPLFEFAEHTHDGSMPTRRGSPAKRTQTVRCFIVGQDLECRDDNDIRIATRHDGHASTVHTLLDVPRDSLTVSSPTGYVALAVQCTEQTGNPAAVPPTKNMRSQTVTEPRSSKQALTAPDSVEWAAAMKKEVETLTNKGTFDFIDTVPAGRKAIACIFKLKLKWNKDGTLDKRKARLVALGNYQEYGVDYEQVFAATSQLSSVHLLLCLAVQHGWHCFHFDIISAFVNASLDETIYVSLPPEARAKKRFARLRKSLYGLKQAANSWANASDKLIMSIPGMTRSATEPSWYNYSLNGTRATVLVYVDDYVVCCNNPDWYTWFVRFFKRTYDLNDLGPLSTILGMGVEWGNDKVILSRRVPIERTLQKFGLGDANPSMYPFEPGSVLKIPKEGENDKPFLNLLGELRYHARSSRPDINTALSVLGRFSAKHDAAHYDCLKRVARYLKGSPSDTLILRKGVGGANGALRLSMYVDASYASCPDTGRSISGYVICLNGSAVFAISKRQETVACSTTEAEIIAFSEGCKDLVYVHRLLSQFHKVDLPMLVHEDNLATIDVLSNPVNNGRTKHIDVRHFWVRELVSTGVIKMRHIDTNRNVADFLTKPLTGDKFRSFRKAILGHALI